MSREKGRQAEEKAAAYLRAQGYEILARNYTVRGAEVDIIAREGDFVVFVEVKYRETARYAAPRESVTAAKQRRLIMAAERWLGENGLCEANVRFDVVEALGDKIALLRAAFDASS